MVSHRRGRLHPNDKKRCLRCGGVFNRRSARLGSEMCPSCDRAVDRALDRDPEVCTGCGKELDECDSEPATAKTQTCPECRESLRTERHPADRGI